MKINKPNFNKRVLMICLISIIAILACGIGYAVQSDSIAKMFGKQQAEVLSNAGDGIVATVDGEKITKKGFDTYKLFLNNSGKEVSDQQVLDKIVDRQLIYKQAIKENVVVSDQEVANAIKMAQDTIRSDSKQYEAFKEYISGLNMSEDEYWKSVEPVYKKALTCGKYKNTLKENFKKDNKIEDQSELNSKFEEFYSKTVKELKGKVEVKSNLK